jgi:prevent-host-death family protein
VVAGITSYSSGAGDSEARRQTPKRGAIRSDNLISMAEISATEAARHFADLLDAVEHRGERYTIVRRGRPVANLEPVRFGRGAHAKAALRRHQPDVSWAADLASLRGMIELQQRQ